MAVNGQPLPDWDRFEEGARQREANFTSTDTAPDGNKIVSGAWWEVGTEQSLVSSKTALLRTLVRRWATCSHCESPPTNFLSKWPVSAK